MNEIFDTNNCFYKLPCGICTRTNEMCPFMKSNATVYDGTAIDPLYKGPPSFTTSADGGKK